MVENSLRELRDHAAAYASQDAEENQGRPVPGQHGAQRPEGHTPNADQVEGARTPQAGEPACGGNDYRTRNARGREDPVDLIQIHPHVGHDLGQAKLGIGGVNGKGNEP